MVKALRLNVFRDDGHAPRFKNMKLKYEHQLTGGLVGSPPGYKRPFVDVRYLYALMQVRSALLLCFQRGIPYTAHAHKHIASSLRRGYTLSAGLHCVYGPSRWVAPDGKGLH